MYIYYRYLRAKLRFLVFQKVILWAGLVTTHFSFLCREQWQILGWEATLPTLGHQWPVWRHFQLQPPERGRTRRKAPVLPTKPALSCLSPSTNASIGKLCRQHFLRQVFVLALVFSLFLWALTGSCNPVTGLGCSTGGKAFIYFSHVEKKGIEVADFEHHKLWKALCDRQSLSAVLWIISQVLILHCCLARAQPIVVWGVGVLSHLFMLFITSWLEYHHSLFLQPPSLFTFYKLHVIKSSCRSGYCNWQSPQSRDDESALVVSLTLGSGSARQAFLPVSPVFQKESKETPATAHL